MKPLRDVLALAGTWLVTAGGGGVGVLLKSPPPPPPPQAETSAVTATAQPPETANFTFAFIQCSLLRSGEGRAGSWDRVEVTRERRRQVGERRTVVDGCLANAVREGQAASGRVRRFATDLQRIRRTGQDTERTHRDPDREVDNVVARTPAVRIAGVVARCHAERILGADRLGRDGRVEPHHLGRHGNGRRLVQALDAFQEDGCLLYTSD